MSITRWPWADHLTRKETGEIGSIEAQIKYLRREIFELTLRDKKSDDLTVEIDSLKLRRQRIVNRGTQRARLAAKRNRPPRPYRKAA